LLAPGLAPIEPSDLDDEQLLRGGIQRLGPGEAVIYKPRWGAFYRTPLHSLLQSEEVDTLVFAGCNYPNCPRASIYEASERDYRIVLVEDATSGLYDRGRNEMTNLAVILQTAEQVIDSLQQSAGSPSRRVARPAW
jgi:nicotinamidase-related amidase